ncbi:MAG: 1-acyl-sn-glycerol-3-phosphate acyltransferase, partial [Candidatus Omnitrophica bacterium]|nr:1-acyl-sn-glycerol-3-phosphate acyltransferase [Candidatus Omnitrophota bacterium]
MPKKKELEQPNRFLYDGVMPKFWPPKPHPFWQLFLYPCRRYFARHIWKVPEVHIHDLAETFAQFDPRDGVLIAPNHSHEADAHVLLEAARKLNSRLYFMAAWQTFTKHKGLDGWVLQRMGAFSVDREGTDRRALRCAMELLKKAQRLVIFPEGEIHHLNNRLKPLLEGVAFIALSAQKQLRKDNREGTI